MRAIEQGQYDEGKSMMAIEWAL